MSVLLCVFGLPAGAIAAEIQIFCEGTTTKKYFHERSADEFKSEWNITIDDKKKVVKSLSPDLHSECLAKFVGLGKDSVSCSSEVTDSQIFCQFKDAETRDSSTLLVNRMTGKLRGNRYFVVGADTYRGDCNGYSKKNF